MPTAIGEKVVEVQKLWKGLYNLPAFPADGSQWDRLFADGERFKIGDLDVEVLFTPGHTLTSIAYLVGDTAFMHDTIFMPDGGTARADFTGGSARALWNSIQRIMALSDEPACSQGTITALAVERRVGRARSRSRKPRTSTSRKRKPRRSSSPCARSVTASSRCPS